MTPTDATLPREALSWVEHALGAGGRVVASERLTGGLTSIVHRLIVERGGVRTPYVLRRWALDQDAYVAAAVGWETRVLAALERTDLPAPRVIDSTTDVAHGGPAVLVTCLPGRIELMPSDRDRWLREMARMLARIHAASITGKPFEPWLDATKLSPPPDASRASLWTDAFALAATARIARTTFIHRDYQHFNLLWQHDEIAGVVDWVEATNGPPELDVGHCRLNLTVLFSADVADRFLAMYEAEAGRRVDPAWDVHALLAYGPAWKHFLPLQIDGRAPLVVDGMTQRMEQVLDRALH